MHVNHASTHADTDQCHDYTHQAIRCFSMELIYYTRHSSFVNLKYEHSSTGNVVVQLPLLSHAQHANRY